jgi:hypothetical protein
VELLSEHTSMTDAVRERGVFERHPFVLIDVGCAGGIAPRWRVFGPTLVAHGFDPDVAACEAAQAREPFSHVHYHARLVGLPDSHPFVHRRRTDAERWPDTNIWSRVTAGDVAARNLGQPTDARKADTATLIGVDEFVVEEGLQTVDFLKIDVDGPDPEILESARRTLVDGHLLGVGMEVNWFGSANPTAHTFHSTDRTLRELGFALFGLSVRRYSRSDLPAPFEENSYARTVFGQPYQGDAVYFRDLAAPHLVNLARAYPSEKLLKLACLYEVFGVPDCAAEVLNVFASRLETFGERTSLLDALTPPLLGERLTYREYLEAFLREPQRFLPSAAHTDARPDARTTTWKKPLILARRALRRVQRSLASLAAHRSS